METRFALVVGTCLATSCAMAGISACCLPG